MMLQNLGLLQLKFPILLVLLTLCLWINIPPTKAYSPGGSCPDLSQIPISVDPTAGDRNSTFKITLFWTELTSSQFEMYKDIDVRIFVNSKEDSGDKPISISGTVIDSYKYGQRQKQDASYNISLNKAGGGYQVFVHLSVMDNCPGYEAKPVSISIADTAGSTTPLVKKRGDICEPSLQKPAGDASTWCPDDAKCERASGLTTGPYACEGISAYTDPAIDARCNTTITLDQMISCGGTNDYDYSYSLPCGSGGKGYVCSDSQAQLCLNGEKKEENVICQKAKTKTGATGSTGAGGGSPCKVNGSDGINTAIGCVPTKPADFIQAVSRLLTGLGGGVALLMMIAGAFRMITSAGNPDAIKAGSEQFSSAIIGLLFIIFAVLLLKVIGVDILNIPGFV